MKLHYCESINDLSAADAIAAADSAGTVDLAVSKDFWDGEEEWEECERSFSGYVDHKVKEYSALLGEPSFKGGMDDPGFPEDYMEQFEVHADYLGMWNYRGARYGISLVQEDRELPFVVSFRKID